MSIVLLRLKDAEAARKEAHDKTVKAQQVKYQQAKKKQIKDPFSPKLIVKPKENVEETVNAAILAQEEEEDLEDKIRMNMITNKERRMWVALLDHLQTTVRTVYSLSKNIVYILREVFFLRINYQL